MGPQVDVHTDSLLPQARAWDEQSGAMAKMVAEIDANQFSKAAAIIRSLGGEIIPGIGVSEDYFLFTNALSAYAQVNAEFGRLCKQGQQMMEKIADALTMAHRNYEVTEGANVKSIDNLRSIIPSAVP